MKLIAILTVLVVGAVLSLGRSAGVARAGDTLSVRRVYSTVLNLREDVKRRFRELAEERTQERLIHTARYGGTVKRIVALQQANTMLNARVRAMEKLAKRHSDQLAELQKHAGIKVPVAEPEGQVAPIPEKPPETPQNLPPLKALPW